MNESIETQIKEKYNHDTINKFILLIDYNTVLNDNKDLEKENTILNERIKALYNELRPLRILQKRHNELIKIIDEHSIFFDIQMKVLVHLKNDINDLELKRQTEDE